MLLSEVDKSVMYMDAFNDGYNKGVDDERHKSLGKGYETGFQNGVLYGIDTLFGIIEDTFGYDFASDIKPIVEELRNKYE